MQMCESISVLTYMYRFVAGDDRHEWTSFSSQDAIFKYFEKRLAVANGEATLSDDAEADETGPEEYDEKEFGEDDEEVNTTLSIILNLLKSI